MATPNHPLNTNALRAINLAKNPDKIGTPANENKPKHKTKAKGEFTRHKPASWWMKFTSRSADPAYGPDNNTVKIVIEFIK